MNVENHAGEDRGEERSQLAELIRKVMLAGIGAASLAQEEAEIFINKLIEKGEIADKEGRDLVKDLREKRRQRMHEHLDKRVAGIVERMKIPTKADLDELREKIADLSKKVDSIKE